MPDELFISQNCEAPIYDLPNIMLFMLSLLHNEYFYVVIVHT